MRGRGRGSASRKRDRFSTYPRISWIDSSTFCRSERSDEQIVRKSWNAPFIRGMRAARRLINMSLLFRQSRVLKHARNVIFIKENQEISLCVLFPRIFNYYPFCTRFLYCYIIITMALSDVFQNSDSLVISFSSLRNRFYN